LDSIIIIDVLEEPNIIANLVNLTSCIPTVQEHNFSAHQCLHSTQNFIFTASLIIQDALNYKLMKNFFQLYLHDTQNRAKLSYKILSRKIQIMPEN